MAESTQSTISREETLARAERSQLLFAETLFSGNLPIEEIEMRTNLAKLFVRIGTIFSAHKPINDAIQYLDAVLRRLSKDCPDRPNVLKELSNAHFESYRLTNSRHSLDSAVIYGLQAQELAIALHLHTHELERYLEILTHLGYFLSYRFQLIGMPKDLDESIACKREILENTPKGSESHGLALINLASALRVSYVNRPRSEDEEEARKLLEELLSSAESGSKLHNIAVGQLGLLATARFHQTQTLEDLDGALVHCKIGLESTPDGDNAQLEMLQNIVTLYKGSYEYTKDPEDMTSVVQHSSLLFESIPATRSCRGKSLLQYLQNVQEWALVEESLEALEHAIGLSQAALASMPDDYQDKALSQLIFTQLSYQRYVLTGTLEELIPLVGCSVLMLTGYNSKIQTGYSRQEVHDDWSRGLSEVLSQLIRTPRDNPMRQLAEEELFGAFISCYGSDSEHYGVAALEEVYRHNEDRLHVLTTAAIADTTLSDEDIELEVSKLKEKTGISNQDLLESLLGSTSEFQTEFGQRKLAIDPETNQITFDFTNLVRDVLGYEEEGVSPDEFVAREERMERESLQEGRSDGEYPNSRLCRWCRHLTKPLKPSEKGFELTADRCMVPTLGDWKMVLYCRGECAVCSLTAAIITTDKGELHADFEKLDQEARGIRMSCGALSTGESVMRVNFGISYAGELRLLTKDNYRQALRQGWDVDEPVPFPQLLDNGDGSIHDTGGQQVNFRLINTWLNECDHNHGTVCNHPRPGNRIMSKIPLTFIDVHQ